MKTPIKLKLSHSNVDLAPEMLAIIQSSKQDLKPYLTILACLLEDLDFRSIDRKWLMERVLHKGLYVLSVELPSFFSTFLAELEEGDGFFSFPSYPQHKKLMVPKFANNLTISIIKSKDDCVSSFKQLYQLCSFFKKMKSYEGISALEEKNAIINYRNTESDVLSFLHDDAILRVANLYASHIFDDFTWDDLDCRPGPGTNCDQPITQKFTDIPSVPSSFSELCVFQNEDHFLDGLSRLNKRSHYDFFQSSSPSEFACVPKDSRGPRTICVEPLARQTLQQGLRRYMELKMETNCLTAGFINFTDQSINGALALSSSRVEDMEYSTIDLKDASDRISLALVCKVFQDLPILDALLEARSDRVLFPDGSTLKLKKFAPQGSAVCFTTLSFVCWVLCHTFLVATEPGAKMFVYGDDLVVPTAHFESCITVLERYGLKANRNKSFSKSYFRESCGTDAYMGNIVTPVKLRHQLRPETLTISESTPSIVSTVRQLWENGLYRSATRLYELLNVSLPPGDGSEPYLSVPHDLVDINIYEYAAAQSKYGPKISTSGKMSITAYTVLTAKAEIAESSTSFFYRGILPSIGSKSDTSNKKVVSSVPMSRLYGFMDLPKKIKVVKRKFNVYPYG